MFKHFRLSIVAIAAIATVQTSTSTAAPAKAQWVYIGSDHCSDYYVNRASLKKNGDFVWFWWRERFTVASEQHRCHIFDEHKFKLVDFYMSLDCQNRTGRFRKIQPYDRSQKLVPEYSSNFGGSAALIPFDRNFVVMRYVCQR